MKKIIATATVAAAALTGCWVPETFDASLDFQKNGGYTLVFDGTLNHGFLMEMKAERGALPKDAGKFLQQEVDALKRMKGVVTAKPIGDTKVQFSAKNTVAEFQPARPLDALDIRRDRDGVYSVTARTVTERDRQAMKRYGVKIAGTLKVTLPSNAKVIQNNAGSTPGILSSAYKWDIDASSPAPVIRFKLN